MGKFVPVGGLWEKSDKHGQTVYSGKLDRWVPQGARLWISPNGRRTNDRQPSHTVSMIEDDEASAAPSDRPPEPPPDYEQRHPPAAHVTPAVGRVVTSRPSQPRMPLGAPANLSRRKEFAGPGSDLDETVPF